MNPSPSPHLHGQTLGMAMSHPPQPHNMGPPPGNGPSSSSSGQAGPPGHMQQQVYHPAPGPGYPGHPLPQQQPGQMHMVQLPPGQAGVFGGVMGAQGPQGGTKVYASVYSGIPVFEAMIRGISVMRRSSDSWVNATQILKVAGIPKSQRTKILDKEILTGLHEKVQGGYGKYQGTWIPFQRGQEVAAQYGVTQYLAPIFDFIPSPSNVAALPVNRGETPDRNQKRQAAGGAAGLAGPSANASAGYNAMISAQTPQGRQAHLLAQSGPPSSAGRMYSPIHPTDIPPPPPPQFGNGDMMMAHHHHQQQQQQQQHQLYQPMYFAPPGMMPGRSTDGLGPPVDLNGYGLPPSQSDVYIDQFGQPHSMHFTNGLIEPPPKRLKPEPGLAEVVEAEESGMEVMEAVAEAAQAEEEESDDEMGEKPPLPSSMRLSSKPMRPKPTAAVGKTRSKLMELFQASETVDVRAFLGIPAPAEDGGAEAAEEVEKSVDIDTIIDDQGHTALHWAASLAQLDLVRQLVELGADIHRGNYAGETALMRSVLTTNQAEANSFPELLQHLAPSIRTLDQAYRTVIHHIALVAGVKGRAGSARQYMTGVLEWVAKEQQSNTAALSGSASTASENGNGNGNGLNGHGPLSTGTGGISLKTLIDVQDIHGDTALNIAARVGNKGLVGLLIDAGADKARANKLGLKPADFGVEIEALKVSPAETVVSNLKSEVAKPERHSRDVQKNIAAIFETVNETFTTEMLSKQTKLNAIEASVRHATRALADKRQQVARAQAALGEMEQIQEKSENVRRALTNVAASDWDGTAPLSSEVDSGVKPPAFRSAGSGGGGSGDGTGEDIPLPQRGDDGALIKLRRMMLWEDRIAATLQDRIDSLQGQGADKAVKYRRLVSLCTKVPVEKVDGMLEDLAAAIESDGNSIDLSRISNFMSRMKQEQPGQVPAV